MLPDAAPTGHNADLNASTSGSTAATSPVCQEEVEMRAALQFLMRHMVKRAVMRSPIKRALGLADLERAQAMIYKLVVNGLLEEPSGGKAKPGEDTWRSDGFRRVHEFSPLIRVQGVFTIVFSASLSLRLL